MDSHDSSTTGTCTSKSQTASEKKKDKSLGVFHIDKDLIPSAQLSAEDTQTQNELKDLGIDVFNQEEFEQGVISQVDKAIAHQEEERQNALIQKQIIEVEDEIKLIKEDVCKSEKILLSLSKVQTNYTKTRISALENQKEDKLNRLQSLALKLAKIKNKLKKDEDAENSNGENAGNNIGEALHSTNEDIVALDMASFSTIPVVKKPPPVSKSAETSEFQKIFKDNERKRISHMKVKEEITSSLSEKLDKIKKGLDSDEGKAKKRKAEPSSESFIDEKSKNETQTPKTSSPVKKNLKKDKKNEGKAIKKRNLDLSEIQSSGDEYKPNKNELDVSEDEYFYSEDDLDEETKVKKKKKTSFGKVKKPPKYYESDGNESEGDTGGKQRLRREDYTERAKDDGNDYFYERRMEKFNKAERNRMQRVENGEESEHEDEELEHGLKVPGRIWSKLYKYQQTGVSWLWELHLQQAGGIIGDEMGLGKTIQMIAFLAALRQSKLRDKNFKYQGLGPTVIVCPTTVMHQWVKEFHTWWPLFRVAILHSSGSFSGSEIDLIKTIVRDRGILVTSYNTLVVHQESLLLYDWHYVVLDEGHKIRNPDAQATLAAKQFRTPHRIILSGSPIQNNLKELWSLFDFVFPGKLGTLPDFTAHFSVPIVQGGYSNASEVQVTTAYKCACVLRDTINPYLLRRMKSDVKIDLPSKNEQVLFCRLADEQREVYKEYLQSRECQSILSGNFQIFAGLIALRKICNHPDLCMGGPRLYIGEDAGEDEELQFGYTKRSGKMIVVQALLKLWKKQGHKVLLFSQGRGMLDILENFTQKEGYSYLRMDGTTPISARQPLISKFNKDPSIFVFLLTTRVGGLGVNLIGANRVVIYDPDWNPSTDTQARERTWRIGQSRHVTIYRLVTTGTIEEKIYHRQIFKQFLTNRILKDPKQRRFFKSNDLYELFELGTDVEGKESTETSALFAGTGSEINKKSLGVKSKKKTTSDNFFDKMFEKKLKEKSVEEDVSEFEEEEVNQMRKVADRLSESVHSHSSQKGKPVANSRRRSSSDSENKPGPSGIKHDSSTLKLSRIPKVSSSSKNIDENPKSILDNFYEDRTDVKISKYSSVIETSNLDELEDGELDADEGTVSNDKDLPQNNSNLKRKQSKKHSHKSSEEHHHKSKKHKKKKDAKFEGTRIPNLVKQRDFKPSSEPNEEAHHGEAMDNYVLKKLFKKTGIQSAMKHDVIMDASKHDYVIVEAEAERVAREAAHALKRSRSACNSALSGMPTWTGQSGVVAAKKPRFGQKKNSILLDPTKPSSTKVLTSSSSSSRASSKLPTDSSLELFTPTDHIVSKAKPHMFDGTQAGNVVTDLETGVSKPALMTSDELIQRMRRRNEVSRRVVEEGQESEESFPANNPEAFQLLTQMRNFILFDAQDIGQATTDEIVAEFRNKVPEGETTKFKAMLKQICDFDKSLGVGTWKLKQELR